ncbi:MAG: hypothetical protein R2716_12670 [Microthrixaceae bacterium]
MAAPTTRLHESGADRDRLVGGLRARSSGGDPMRVSVVLDARRAPDALLRRTVEALEGQWTPEWDLVIARSDDQLQDAVGSVATEDERRPLTVLCAGDRPRPDLFARVLDAFWVDASLELVHWDEAVRNRGPLVPALLVPGAGPERQRLGEGLRPAGPPLERSRGEQRRPGVVGRASGGAVAPGCDSSPREGGDDLDRPPCRGRRGASDVVSRELARRGWPAAAPAGYQCGGDRVVPGCVATGLGGDPVAAPARPPGAAAGIAPGAPTTATWRCWSSTTRGAATTSRPGTTGRCRIWMPG